MYPLYRLLEAGWKVDVAAPSRRSVQLVVHDFEASTPTPRNRAAGCQST